MARPKKEQEEKNFEKDKAEMKKRQEERKKRMAIQNRKKSLVTGQFESLKSRSERLNLALKNILDRLIKETGGGFIEDVVWDDPKSITLRKSQLQNLKDLITIARQMRDLISEVRDDESGEQADEAVSAENITLLDDARKELKKMGVELEL